MSTYATAHDRAVIRRTGEPIGSPPARSASRPPSASARAALMQIGNRHKQKPDTYTKV
jgi:hypothetical protein